MWVNVILVVGIVAGLLLSVWPQLPSLLTRLVLRSDDATPDVVPEPEPEPELTPIQPADDRASMLARVMVLRDQLAADPGCVRAIDYILIPGIMARGVRR